MTKEQTHNEELAKQSDFIVNTCYLMAVAMDLMIRESERLLRKQNPPQGWKFEKKQMFNRFLDYTKKACLVNEQICQDIFDVEAKHDYKYVDIWQEEANELTRFILMIADRTSDLDVINQVHTFIRQFPGDGYCSEELLNRFYLNKGK